MLISCNKESEITTITNPYHSPVLDTELDLQSNSGVNLHSVTINWQIEGISIINGDTTPAINNSITFDDMQPSTFRDIIFELPTPDGDGDGLPDSTYHDTIQIYTRSVYPVTDFESIIEQIEKKNTFFDFKDWNPENGICDMIG